MSKENKKVTLRDMVVVRGFDFNSDNEFGNFVLTLGEIVDIFLYFLRNILPFSRVSIEDESELGDDMRSLYTCSLKVYKKIERRFTTRLARLLVEKHFSLRLEKEIVEVLYEAIRYVLRYYDFGENEWLRDSIGSYKQYSFCEDLFKSEFTPLSKFYEDLLYYKQYDAVEHVNVEYYLYYKGVSLATFKNYYKSIWELK